MTLLWPARPAARPAALALAMLMLSFGVAFGTLASGSQDELDWARGALQRNRDLQVVAADRATGIITVRIKSTGELHRVRAGDVIAALPPDGGAAAGGFTSTADAAPLPSRQAGSPASHPGRVLLAGPGYRITAVGPPADPSASAPPAVPATAVGGALLTSSIPLEHWHEPIVCQGARLLHIDSRNLQFDGDAVSAEDGCEVHITNSRIVAKGFGVSAHGASVHIDNSSIEGQEGSVDASDGAQVYAQSSTFKGLIRRLDTAAFHDMGGNAGD